MTTNQGTRVKVSPTTLNLLRDCPRCFWFRMNGDLKRPTGPPPVIGQVLDRIIQAYWNSYREQGSFPPLIPSVEGRPVPPGVREWSDPTTGLVLAGRLDACIEVDGPLYVPVDHKTRGSPPNGTHPAYQLQLDGYALLLEVNGRPSAGYGLLIYYMPRPGQLHEGLPIAVQIDTVQTDPERAQRWMRDAREVLDLPEPPPSSPACEYCAWVEAVSPYR
ncbi:MAG: PD-(D/E)XK nuclease family protein [Dehalococcoidia bacterium]